MAFVSPEQCLTVIYRVEAGCLGPEGESHVYAFCQYAQKTFDELDLSYVIWQLTPRINKSHPEIQYQVNEKILSHAQATQYLRMFHEDIEEFQSLMEDTLSHLVEDYFKR